MNRLLNDFLPDASAPDDTRVIQGIQFPAQFNLITEVDIKSVLKPRVAFSHKGTYGHVLIVAGARETMGAAILTAKGCLYAGAGLTTAAIPVDGLTALNAALPEVMYVDKRTLVDAAALTRYNAIAVGPGLLPGAGISSLNMDVLEVLFGLDRPLIMDADILTFMGSMRPKAKSIAENSILTPHVKEFDSMFGKHNTWWERLKKAVYHAKRRRIIIVLKNQYTFIIDGTGRVFINPTGNPAMAQGGMGDVLTGILAAFVAQGYHGREAAMLACYVHGLAGDELAKTHACISASELACQVSKTIKSLLE